MNDLALFPPVHNQPVWEVYCNGAYRGAILRHLSEDDREKCIYTFETHGPTSPKPLDLSNLDLNNSGEETAGVLLINEATLFKLLVNLETIFDARLTNLVNYSSLQLVSGQLWPERQYLTYHDATYRPCTMMLHRHKPPGLLKLDPTSFNQAQLWEFGHLITSYLSGNELPHGPDLLDIIRDDPAPYHRAHHIHKTYEFTHPRYDCVDCEEAISHGSGPMQHWFTEVRRFFRKHPILLLTS